MEVTRANFDLVLPTLDKVFGDAVFIAIDTEFTGLRVKDSRPPNRYDTFEIVYQRKKELVSSFIVIQFGIVAFYFDKNTNRQQGYNFYIYPSQEDDNVNFTCQAGSLRFLASNGFDFNKLLLEGISYIREPDLKSKLEHLDEQLHIELKTINEVSVANEEPMNQELSAVVAEVAQIISSKQRKKIKISGQKAVQRRKTYKILKSKFKEKVFLNTNSDDTIIADVGLTSEQYKEQMEQKYENIKKRVLDEVGFTKVIQLLIKSGKLIVGHNMLLDLMFTVEQFIKPLPNTLAEFATMVNFIFPNILDVKVLAAESMLTLKDTSLDYIYEEFKNSGILPQVETLMTEKSSSESKNMIHQAAYDAYLTGLCFLAMCKELGDEKVICNELMGTSSAQVLSNIINKVHAPKLNNFPQYIDFVKGSPKVDRSNVFHLSFPKTWTRTEILKLFRNCGPIEISWINKESAYIIFRSNNPSKIRPFLNDTNGEYKMTTFEDYNSFKESTVDDTKLNNAKNNVDTESCQSEESVIKKRLGDQHCGQLIENNLR